VGAFAALAEVGEQELSGMVARPSAAGATDDFKQLVRTLVDRNDLGMVLAAAADAIGQREQGRHDADGSQSGGQPAERALPESIRHQDQAVEGAGQENGAESLVHPAEIAVGNALDQGYDDQRHQDVASPFAKILGQVDPHIGLTAWSARAAWSSDQAGLGQVLGQPLDHPVREHEEAGADADVFVQPVQLIQPAETLFQPGGAGGEQHAGAHPPQGEQAGEDDERAAPSPGAFRVGSEDVGQGKDSPEAEGDEGEDKQGAFHDGCGMAF